MATISLCMIGQDEAHCVRQNIEPCLPFIDELIFIDGGSVDGTQHIVRAIPTAKVYEIPFPDHFAQQKNEALERTTMDWILFKDCDEWFEPDILENLHRIMSMDADAFSFCRKTYLDGQLCNLEDADRQIRLWWNAPEIRYEGKLHETVVGYSQCRNLNLWIIHDKSFLEQQKDNERYWDLGQEPPPGWTKENGKWVQCGNVE